MKRLLVTGGAGFIGCNFLSWMLATRSEFEIWCLDALTYAGKRENLKLPLTFEKFHFIHGDICDAPLVESILRDNDIDTIVHFAAETHVDRSIDGPAAFIQTNVVGTFTLLEAARRRMEEGHPIRFHHVSTDEVFGALQPGDAPFCETTPYSPNSPYSASKASSDHLVRAYYKTYGLPVTISNCSNNYGQYQYPEKLIPLTIINGMMEKPMPVYGKGAQVRDWLYVYDHCSAIEQILDRGTIGETYCIGGENQPSNLEIVETICDILDEHHPRANGKSHHELITFVKDRPGHDFRYDIDTSKIRRELDWKPVTDLEFGLEETVLWYLQNGEWISSVLGKSEFTDWWESPDIPY